MTDVIIEGRTFQLGDVVKDAFDVTFIIGQSPTKEAVAVLITGYESEHSGYTSKFIGGDVYEAVVLGNINDFNCNK